MPKQYPQRKSPRLKGYDYSQSGAYFVTICTHNHKHLFGKIVDDKMLLGVAGEIAYERWLAVPNHHPFIELDLFVVMPNHTHGIVLIHNENDKASSLSTVVGSYKSGVTRRIRQAIQNPELKVWQGRFYDNIIHDETMLNTIRQYTISNPAKWAEDKFYS